MEAVIIDIETGDEIRRPLTPEEIADAEARAQARIVYAELQNVDRQVQTTDETPLEVFRFISEVKHIYRATFRMTAIDASSGVARDTEARMVFKRTAAALTQIGTTAILANFADTAAASWAILPTVDGTDLVISVRGAAGRTINWLLVGEIGRYCPEGLGA